MAKVIGFEPKLLKRFVCQQCAAIVEYAPMDVVKSSRKDEGVEILVVACPNCHYGTRVT